jgi:hypothetical protein
MNLVTILGVVGASLILLGFIANRLKYWQSDSLSYVVINALGSLVLIVYSTLIESYPFIALNIIWLLFSVNDIVKRSR